MDGWAAPAFRTVALAFKRNLELDLERGGGFAVYHRGELVVDLVGGYMDEEHQRPWTRDTLAQMMSVTKSLSALCVAKLVDDGKLNLSSPVALHWPEFSFAGKQSITIEQLLSHQAGLLATEVPMQRADILLRPDKLADQLAQANPAWSPGSAHGFHGSTYGLLIDHLVRRVDKRQRTLQQFFHEELAIPTAAQLFIGLQREHFWKLARNYEQRVVGVLSAILSLDWPQLHHLYLRIMGSNHYFNNVTKTISPQHEVLLNYSPERAEVPDSSLLGFGTANSLARFFSVLATRGVLDGQRVLSKTTVHRWLQPVTSGIDLVLDTNVSYGLGMELEELSYGDLIGHRGYGGQFVLVDPREQLSMAYLTNHLHPYSKHRNPVHSRLLENVYQSVHKINSRSKKKG